MRDALDLVGDEVVGDALDPEDALARDEAVRAAISRFVALAPVQRSCVILTDVLGHSLDEIAALLELSIPAVKAALHRGRVRLREQNQAAAREATMLHEAVRPVTPLVERYARMFDAQDWDGIRAMLADDVKLDLVSRSRRSGRRDVGGYFANYVDSRLSLRPIHPPRCGGRPGPGGLLAALPRAPG